MKKLIVGPNNMHDVLTRLANIEAAVTMEAMNPKTNNERLKELALEKKKIDEESMSLIDTNLNPYK